MTLEPLENKSKPLSKQEILDCFKGVGQTEIPLRDLVILPKTPKRAPSDSRLSCRTDRTSSALGIICFMTRA